MSPGLVAGIKHNICVGVCVTSIHRLFIEEKIIYVRYNPAPVHPRTIATATQYTNVDTLQQLEEALT